MIKLEFLNQDNEEKLKKIRREDIPSSFAEDISDTIELSKWGEAHGLRGHCYAIKYGEQYVGVVLIGEAIEDEADPVELQGSGYFRLIGFVIDQEYRGRGIGSKALELALDATYREYGAVPILLECHQDNERALKFYARMGFRNTNILNNEDYFLIKQ